MERIDTQALPAPPSLIKSILAGFDAVSNHISLIFFSVAIDLLLWLGPHLALSTLIHGLFDQAAAMPSMNTPEMADMVSASREMWSAVAAKFNLMSVIRSYPIGVPSLMVSSAPTAVPGGSPAVWQIPSVGAALGIFILLTLSGLLVGTLYFQMIAQATLEDKIDLRTTLARWPRSALQVFLLALMWVALLIALSIPFSCLLSFSLVAGMGIGQFAILLFGGLVVWLLFPLVFSPHGIFAYKYPMWTSLREGIRLTRATLPSTGLFLLIILVISEGLDMLWRVPAETSWFTMIGVTGHAFITAALLSATFIYYRDATVWLQGLLERSKMALAEEESKNLDQ
ncbi:MAG: hypothetical protein P8Z00_02580 [Anaerolineales bacterium]|jgi:hypothetical protein